MNNKLQAFEQFLTQSKAQIPFLDFSANLVAAALLSYVVGLVYVRYGYALSNRRSFARNFMPITMTTLLIIAIVKSSLALSLGLVGALSIVRFRTAIKEPEELTYTFLAIAIGLGFGAGQGLVTSAAALLILGLIALRRQVSSGEERQNLHLSLSSHGSEKAELPQLVATLKAHCRQVSMKRFDESDDLLEAIFLIEFTGFEQLNQARSALRQSHPTLQIRFLDSSGA